jgi:hypothetical protein
MTHLALCFVLCPIASWDRSYLSADPNPYITDLYVVFHLGLTLPRRRIIAPFWLIRGPPAHHIKLCSAKDLRASYPVKFVHVSQGFSISQSHCLILVRELFSPRSIGSGRYYANFMVLILAVPTDMLPIRVRSTLLSATST